MEKNRLRENIRRNKKNMRDTKKYINCITNVTILLKMLRKNNKNFIDYFFKTDKILK